MSRSEQGFDASQRRLALGQQQPSQTLRPLRCRAELSQRELARRAGVPANTVRYAERGSIPLRENQEKIAVALSQALDCTIHRFDLWPLLAEEAA